MIAPITRVDLQNTWKQLLLGTATVRDEKAMIGIADEVVSAVQKLRDAENPAWALVLLLNRAGVQRVREEFGSLKSVSFAEHLVSVAEFHSDLDHWLKMIDPEYSPQKRDTRGLDIASLAGYAEWQGITKYGVVTNLCAALERAGISAMLLQGRALHDVSAIRLERQVDQIVYAAFEFRILRWRLQKWIRARTEKPDVTEITRSYLEQNRLWELKALWFAAQSAGECGEFTMEGAISAKLIHEIAQSYADRKILDEQLVEAVRCSCDSVRALGYSVPSEFRNEGKFSKITGPRLLKKGTPDSFDEVDLRVLPCSVREGKSEKKRRSNVRSSRLYRIYRIVSRDEFTLLADSTGMEFHDNPFQFLKHLVSNKTIPLKDSDCQRIFDACVKVDRLRWAFNLLRNRPSWKASADSLCKLAHRLIVAQRALPAGIRDKKQEAWLADLCNMWGSVETTEDHDLLIHQGVLGRITSLAMGSGTCPRDTCLVAGTKTAERVKHSRHFRRLEKVDGFDELQGQVLKFGSSVPTVVASAAPRGSGFHACALASNHHRHSGPIPDTELETCRKAAKFLRSAAHRQSLLGGAIFNSKRMKPLMTLAERLLDLTVRLDPSSRLLNLAIEPDLANIPWNVLFAKVGGEKAPLVSLIPSLSWLRDHKRPELVRCREKPARRYMSASIEMLSRAYPTEQAQFIRLTDAANALVKVTHRVSLSVVVAHGLWDATAQITTVSGPNGPITLQAWQDLFSASLVVINSCHSGRTGRHLIADLAGLPGLGLATGCRCLLAPLTRLRPGDLADLCEVLASDSDGSTVLSRLGAAFARNPATRQIGVFGDPTVKLCGTAGPEYGIVNAHQRAAIPLTDLRLQ